MFMNCLCRLEGVRTRCTERRLPAASPSTVTVWVLLIILAFASVAGAEAIYFDGPLNYAAGSSPRQLVTADFNNDGRPDVAVANSGTVSILLNNGDGSFAPAVNYTAGSFYGAIAAGDFNGDGNVDFAVTSYFSSTVSVLLGNGDGSFQPKTDFATGGDQPIGIGVGDFNGDGRLDLAIANEGKIGVCTPSPCTPPPPDYVNSGNIGVLLGNGDGSFQPASRLSIAGRPIALAVSDLNGDGKVDVAAVNVTIRKISILGGLGNGSFQSPFSVGSVTDKATDIVAADLNNDGLKDLVVADDTKVSMFMGVGANIYSTGSTIYIYNARAVAAGDLNGDGIVDLVVSQDSSGSNIHVALGKGDGTFHPTEIYSAGSSPRGGRATDADGNGRLDIVVANFSSNNVSVLLNKGIKLVSPTSASFSGMKLNVPSAPKTFVIKNSTAEAETISSLSLAGTDSSMFTVIPGGETPCLSLNPTLAPNESCTILVVFTPTAFYERKASLVITTDGPASRTETVSLSGQASPYRVDIAWTGAGSGSVQLNPGNVTYTAGPAYRYFYTSDPVTLTALPGGTSLFGGWTGCDTAAGAACTLTMNGDKTATVRFNPSTVLVSASVVSGSGTITPTSASVSYGGSQLFAIVPAAGYTLQDLSDNGTAVSPVSDGAGGYTYTVTNATELHSLQVNFVPAPPDTIIASGPASFTRATSFSFTFTSTIPGSTFECNYNDAGYRPCSSPYAPYFFVPLSDGRYTFSVRAISPAGVYDPTPASHTWIIDTTPPTGTVAINGNASTTMSRDVTLTINANASITGQVCILVYPFICGPVDMQLSNDGLTWTQWEPARTSVVWQLTEGNRPKNVLMRLRDPAGNERTVSDSITLAVPPSSVITSPSIASYLNAPCITVTGTAAAAAGETLRSIEVSTNGGSAWSPALGTTAWSYQWCPAAEGSYTVISRATDSTGAVETPGAGIAVTIDRTPPSGTLAWGSGEYVLNASDGGNCVQVYPTICGYIEMLLSNSMIWQPASTHVPLGITHLQLRDRAGNIRFIPAPTSWNVGNAERIQDAFNSVPPATDLKVSASSYAENLTFGREGVFRLSGGYDSTFSAVSGKTLVTGKVLISAGSVSLANMTIRGDVTVEGGGLEVADLTVE